MSNGYEIPIVTFSGLGSDLPKKRHDFRRALATTTVPASFPKDVQAEIIAPQLTGPKPQTRPAITPPDYDAAQEVPDRARGNAAYAAGNAIAESLTSTRK